MKQWSPRSGFSCLLLALLAGCTHAPAANSAAAKSDDIPESLRAPAAAVFRQRLHATGVQIYRCNADKNDAAHFSWILRAPEADLFDAAGHRIGRHYAGPTWEAQDGSRVSGEVAARFASPDSNSIPWLLLKATSTPAAMPGGGLFAGVRFVQRLHTVGGNAPADGCGQAYVDREVRVPYSAEYWFYAYNP